MSKREIQNLCTLAAHLARHQAMVLIEGETRVIPIRPHEGLLCQRAAFDAMALQRLGRRTRNMFKKLSMNYRIEWAVHQKGLIQEAADKILKPYGLRSEVSGEYTDFFILGLPSNTQDPESGYAI